MNDTILQLREEGIINAEHSRVQVEGLIRQYAANQGAVKTAP